MKVITAVIAIALMLGSCATRDTGFAQIRGQYTGDKQGKEVHLCKVEHGKTETVAVTQFSADSSFGFLYAVEKAGVYVVNVRAKGNQRNDLKDYDLKRFYLDKGDVLVIEMSDDDYKLLHTDSDKNKLLTEWNHQIDSVWSYSHGFMHKISDYTTFFPLLPGYVKQADAFKSKINSGDPEFDELMTLMVETDMNIASLKFLYTPRSKHPMRDVYPDYYDYVLAERAPQSNRLLDLPNGYHYTRLYAMYAVMSSPEKPSESEWIVTSLSKIPNELLKGYYALEKVESFKSYDESYLAYKKLIEPYLLSDYLKEKVKAFEMTIRKFEAGVPAFDFAGTDVTGKEHKLSDYKGNLVYVDVWATWCGPCKEQMPALKELEKKFHGQPVTFLSISVDHPKNRSKWEEYVKDEQLKGVQLMADKAFESDVAQAYSINAIPRFMIFDGDGNIITTKAPRPSDEKTEGYLRKLL